LYQELGEWRRIGNASKPTIREKDGMTDHVMNRDAFGSWLDALGRAWEAKDGRAFVQLFADEATYQVTPFEEPLRGRTAILEYMAEATRTQDQIFFEYEVLGFDEDRGIAHWQVEFISVPSQTRVELDGTFVVYFDAGRRCTVFREWWHQRESEPE
jgi:uncharacterized protein (TIGR02246 family)